LVLKYPEKSDSNEIEEFFNSHTGFAEFVKTDLILLGNKKANPENETKIKTTQKTLE
jgi:hypothetical protein